MNLAGLDNLPAKNRWRKLLLSLASPSIASNVGSLGGDAAIVQTMVDNLGAASPLPMYFTDYRWPDTTPTTAQVLITSDMALGFIQQNYIKIALPMKPYVTA
jgi:hypothetical protein